MSTVPREKLTPVTIRNVDIPFWSMVEFMVKWVVASIPAGVILALGAMGVIAVLQALLAAMVAGS